MGPQDIGAAPPSGGVNPDVSLLKEINGLADSTPGWLDGTLALAGEYGIIAVVALLWAACWWRGSRTGSAVAALLWAPVAAGIALLINMPIREFVERPRPFNDHDGVRVLLDNKDGYSFVSDHSTIVMAVAVGLFIANRRYGLAALGLALLQGFARVFAGVHYPSDVVGGFALGTAVALLLAPLGMAALGVLLRWAPGWLVRPEESGPRSGSSGSPVLPELGPGGRDDGEELAA